MNDRDWQTEYENTLARLMQSEQEKQHLRLIAEGLRGALERFAVDYKQQGYELLEMRLVRVAAIQAELEKYPLPEVEAPPVEHWPAREIAIGRDGERTSMRMVDAG